MRLGGYGEAQLRLVYRVIAWNNSARLWGEPSATATERDMATEKQRRVIGDALARAIWDAPLPVLQKLREEGYHDQAVDAITRGMVRELAHARWQMKGPPRTDNCTLEGFFHSAIRMSRCQDMAGLNPDVAKVARMEAVDRICATLQAYKVVLVQWRRR